MHLAGDWAWPWPQQWAQPARSPRPAKFSLAPAPTPTVGRPYLLAPNTICIPALMLPITCWGISAQGYLGSGRAAFRSIVGRGRCPSASPQLMRDAMLVV